MKSIKILTTNSRLPTANCQLLLNIAFISFLIFILYSCDKNRLFDESIEIPDTGWNQDSVIVFKNIGIQDTSKTYNFYINLRNTTDYRYSNIYFFLNTQFPDGKIRRDTIELILAGNDGRWFGKGFGHIRDNQILIRNELKFPQPGKYIFKFEQAMRKENLKEIKDIGIRIEYQ